MTDEATTSEEKTNNADTMINVGEISAYKSVEDLIKGKAEADKYIGKLLAEAKEKDALIEELQKNTTIAEELKQIRETNMMDMENTNPSVTEDAIKEIALKAMQESNKAKQDADNLSSCKKAVEALGGDVELTLKNKAAELGCTVEYLESIAKTSPKAFKSMFGITDKVSFETVNFLQSSRQISNTNAEPINTANLKDPKALTEFFTKAMKDPTVLNNLKKW